MLTKLKTKRTYNVLLSGDLNQALNVARQNNFNYLDTKKSFTFTKLTLSFVNSVVGRLLCRFNNNAD